MKEEVMKAAVDLKDTTDRAKEYERSTISTIDIPYLLKMHKMRPILQVIIYELRRYARQLHVNGTEHGCPV